MIWGHKIVVVQLGKINSIILGTVMFVDFHDMLITFFYVSDHIT